MDSDQTGSTLFASLLILSVMLGNYLQETTSADDIFRCIFFLSTLKVNLLITYCWWFQALQFNRVVDDLLSWIDEVENQLMSEDHGKDLTSVKNLLKKQHVRI